MNQNIPVRVRNKKFEAQLERMRAYLEFYHKNHSTKEEACLARTQATMELIGNLASKTRTGSLELTTYLVTAIMDAVEQDLKMVGIYEQEEDAIYQFRMLIKQKQSFINDYAKEIFEEVEVQKKNKVKDRKNAQFNRKRQNLHENQSSQEEKNTQHSEEQIIAKRACARDLSEWMFSEKQFSHGKVRIKK